MRMDCGCTLYPNKSYTYVPAVQLTHVPLESTNSGGPTDFKGCFARIDAASCLLDTIERMANRVALLTPLLVWTAALLAAQWPASVMASELQCGPDVRPIWCCKCTIIILVTVYAW